MVGLVNQTRNAQSPVIALQTADAKAVVERLRDSGVTVSGPNDHGFAYVVSFWDPDGNLVEILEPTRHPPTP
ncbi:MAG: VOC family protein [Pseudomonadales bacterium]